MAKYHIKYSANAPPQYIYDDFADDLSTASSMQYTATPAATLHQQQQYPPRYLSGSSLSSVASHSQQRHEPNYMLGSLDDDDDDDDLSTYSRLNSSSHHHGGVNTMSTPSSHQRQSVLQQPPPHVIYQQNQQSTPSPSPAPAVRQLTSDRKDERTDDVAVIDFLSSEFQPGTVPPAMNPAHVATTTSATTTSLSRPQTQQQQVGKNHQQNRAIATASSQSISTRIPPDIVASQERAWQEAKRAAAARASSSRAITPYCRDLIIPESTNPAGSDSIHPRRQEMKQLRKVKTTAGALSGALVGTVILPGAGTLLGGAVGGASTYVVCKQGEKRAQRKWEQRTFQTGADESAVARHADEVAFC